MDAPRRPAPTRTDRAEAAQRERAEREAAALRENLRRRKAQSRARTEDPAPSPESLRRDPPAR